jgi:hypothetical protein
VCGARCDELVEVSWQWTLDRPQQKVESTELPTGHQASCVPRMGDASASAQLHGMTARAGVDHLGFSALYRGEATIGCGRVVDRGYVDRGRGVTASTRRNNNPTVEAWCAQVL